MKYITIPVEVDALQFSKSTMGDIQDFVNENCTFTAQKGKFTCEFRSGIALVRVQEGDYIVKDAKGGITIEKSGIFETKYVKKV